MFPLLYKYLMLHDEVCIPGLGRFLKDRTSATLNFSEKVFEPPVHTIIFREEPVHADKNFFSFLAKEKNLDEVEAVRHFHEFAYDLKYHINHHAHTELPGLGTMKKNENGEIIFEPNNLLHEQMPETPAERIIRHQSEHRILVGDTVRTNAEMQNMLDENEASSKKRWWLIGAITLFILAIGGIAYYYFRHGNIRL